jgi:predicted ATPase
MNIVETGMKIDLHIHSKASSAKDGAKVKNNTKENLPLLVGKLNDNEVNICAITDHDVFSYELYSELKKAEIEDNTIKKVLPGVEFSVQFSLDNSISPIHIIAIFSDLDDEKVKKIAEILDINNPSTGGAYSEEEFLSILREIDIDTILIAHQKNSLSSQKPRKNDANSLGNAKFLEFVYTDYFEAFEFKNKRNEILNKAFLTTSNLEESLRFITGTDCHDWSCYPSEDLSDKMTDFPYTYAKCLPTFKGLVMAITDYSRLKTVNSFFNGSQQYVKKMSLKVENTIFDVPLSQGINVIIGDNSIGKSLLLHALTNFEKPGAMKLPAKTKSGYMKYIQKNKLEIMSKIPIEGIFCFDMQGEVRAKFEENKLNASDFLREYFPPPVNSRVYRNAVENEIKRMIQYLKKKFDIESQINKLNVFEIPIIETAPESLTYIQNLRKSKQKTEKQVAVFSKINEIVNELEELLKLDIGKSDSEYILSTIQLFKVMKEKYNRKIKCIESENEKVEKVAKAIAGVAEKHKKTVTDNQKTYSSFSEKTDNLIEQIVDLLKKRKRLSGYKPQLLEKHIRPNSSKIFDYEFISKLNIERIDTDYINALVNSTLKIRKKIDWDTITEPVLKNSLLKYDESIPVLEFFELKIKERLDKDFENTNAIIFQGMDKYEEMSSGLDAKIYFDLLSYEVTRSGVYIIDQPEDNISQSAIRNYLLSRFKTMGENRQIIMVTHNPQFIVNLDIDNLVFISKKDGKIKIQSGALEYACTEYNVLDIVAQNIDGGLETIQKRWKRYDKVASI